MKKPFTQISLFSDPEQPAAAVAPEVMDRDKVEDRDREDAGRIAGPQPPASPDLQEDDRDPRLVEEVLPEPPVLMEISPLKEEVDEPQPDDSQDEATGHGANGTADNEAGEAITARPALAAKKRAIPSKRGRKSLKQVAAEADLIDIPGDEVLFSKQYYSMGEVAEMFRVNQSLLRFWETEFTILQPRKNKKGDRHFRPVDIKNLHLIYHLLRQRKYTIEGAKDFLKKNKKAEERFETIQRLQRIKAFLLELKAQL